MLPKTVLALPLALLSLSLGSISANAADLADHRFQNLFAGKPVKVVKPKIKEEDAGPFIPLVYAPGYYGRMGDFGQRNYYGTSLWDIWSRQPYACFPSPSGEC
jgi:hypothetical protein